MRFRLIVPATDASRAAHLEAYDDALRRAGVLLARDGADRIIEVRSAAEAAEWANRCPAAEGGAAEVRPLLSSVHEARA